MSAQLTVSQVLAWQPASLTAQATEWDRQGTELLAKSDEQYRAVDASDDSFRGQAGNAMRDRFTQMYEKARKVAAAWHAGRDAAKIASLNFTTAKSMLEQAKSSAEAKGITVAEDGTCSVSQWSRIRLYSALGGDADRYNTALAALQIDADAQTSIMRGLLDEAARIDSEAVTAIEEAFADMPAADSFGNATTPQSPTPNLTPPQNGTPQQNREWWDSLSAEQQADIVRTNPSSVGNLDGLPATVRDEANRAQIGTERTRLTQDLDAANTVLKTDPNNAIAVKQREIAQKKLDDLNKVDELVTGKQDVKLLLLDMQSGERGRVAVAYGDPDTADHISVTTPGLGTNADGSLSDMMDEAETLKAEAEHQLRDADKSEETVATVAWIGYDPPQKDLTIGGVNTGYPDAEVILPVEAQQGAAPLARFYEGLDVASTDNDPHITALGHSYGSLTTSLALQESNGGVDDVVFYGSPGLGGDIPAIGASGAGVVINPNGLVGFTESGLNDTVDNAGDLGLQDGHVYEMSEVRDPVALADAFGRSPGKMDWVTHLDTSEIVTEQGTYTGATGHAEYPRTDPNTGNLHRSGYNLAAVVAGLPDNATNPKVKE